MNIIFLEPLSVSQDAMYAVSESLKGMGHAVVYYDDRPGTLRETALRIREADIAVVTDLSVPRSVIEKAKKLKFIIAAFPTHDHVDIEACIERGIMVRHIEGYTAYAVAELAIAMMISLLRSMINANEAMRTGEHDVPYLGEELHGKTIGIIGLGDVGIRVAQIAAVLGCRVFAYDLTPSGEAYLSGVTYVKLEQLFTESDIVSIHCPLTPQTEGMVTYDLLSTMKPSALIINVGRSPVIDVDGLIRALREKKIAGAGIDTKEKSRMEKDHTLLTFDNVIITPHIGYRTRESFERRLDAVEKNILEWLEEHNSP